MVKAESNPSLSLHRGNSLEPYLISASTTLTLTPQGRISLKDQPKGELTKQLPFTADIPSSTVEGLTQI